MSGTLSLNGTWGVTWAEGSPLIAPAHLMAEGLRGRKLLPARVPAPIHQVLQEAGLLADPNFGLNSLSARWVEEQFWVYRHNFTVPAEAATEHAWLIFERLEFQATVLLNGEEVGTHANAHRPARFEVTGKLRPGENLLVVKLSSGMHELSEKSATEYITAEMELLTKRHWQRKPAYQCGWDWNPRLVNVGILGDVSLEWRESPRLDQVTVFALPAPDLQSATLTVRATVEGLTEAPVTGRLRARVIETGQEISAEVALPFGESRHELSVALDHPRLWWPRGHGEQNLYTVEVSLEAAGDTQTVTRRTGVRRVEIDQSPHPVEGQHFILTVNGRRIFCKGANWVSPDLLYSTVTAERYRALLELAAEAHFNLLRIWGGGIFAEPAMLELCDEMGLMLWHDLLFACAKYPGDDPAFAAEIRREVTWALHDRAHHPSLVVWCGNNEIEWGDWAWGYDNALKAHPHYAIFHHDLPKIAAAEHPSAAYWISSPYSPDYKFPNDPTVGDQHPWGVSIISEKGYSDFWEYRAYVDRFPNEGGVPGAGTAATLRQFLPEGEQELLSPSWDHHDNSMCVHAPVPGGLGRAYGTVEFWTGRDPLGMSLDQYAFASGLLQAEGLSEYIGNYRRRMFSSASAIFWMFADSWPATHSWTIVDYYLRRRLAFHPVRRAFQPVTVVVTEESGVVTVHGVNDTPEPWRGALRYGLFALAGSLPLDETRPVELPANASTPLAEFPREQWEALGLAQAGAFALLLQEGQLHAQHRLFLERFPDLRFNAPRIGLALEGGTLTLTSPVFVWGVCLDADGDVPVPDNCFDLLPGIPYRLPWSAELGEPQVVRVGSRDVVAPS
jgi:beta-mannosidase